MEDVVLKYQKLICLLEEELESVGRCFQGDILETYRQILREERLKVQENLQLLYYSK